MSELIYASATELAESIRAKDISSAEVVDAHIERIEEVNPRLNAVVQLAAEQARKRAKEADEALAKGQIWGPLHGLPFTVKDAIESADVVNTAGTLGRRSYMPNRDATVITRLRGAGGILLGNTNVPELCLAGESDNLVYGRTNNPYDTSRTPGGSSGGEAALIASGGSPLGLGSDVGGSVRQPAHYCGIAGIKPTTGRIPTTGHWPALDGLLGSMFEIGPMARFVEDLVLAMPVLSGPDWRDPYAAPVPLGDPDDVDLASLRIATFTDSGVAPADGDTVATVDSVVEALAEAGISIEEGRPTGIEESQDLFMAILRADAGAGVRDLLSAAGTSETHPLLQQMQERQGSEPLSAAEFADLLVRLDEFRGTMLSFMETYDAIVCPVWATPAIPHGTFFDEVWPDSSYSLQFNLTGWPGAVVRAGTSGDGLPIGVQIVARPWREDVALSIARHIEEAFGGWRPPPI